MAGLTETAVDLLVLLFIFVYCITGCLQKQALLPVLYKQVYVSIICLWQKHAIDLSFYQSGRIINTYRFYYERMGRIRTNPGSYFSVLLPVSWAGGSVCSWLNLSLSLLLIPANEVAPSFTESLQ
jgi:hypothetical protein